MIRKLLVGIDGGLPSDRALEMAIELAQLLESQIGLLYVADSAQAFHSDPAVFNEAIEKLRAQGDRFLEAAHARIPSTLTVQKFKGEGDPAQTIIDAASQWGADMIVLGTDGRGRLSHFLLGSTADTVIRRAHCPVMTVRSDAMIRSTKPAIAASVA